MALSVNTNISSLIAQRNVSQANDEYSSSVRRLSSGLRISRASDDAAGLAVSEKLKSHSRSIYQAVRNANEGVNLMQVADGALKETGNVLQRMRELSEQASNGSLGTNERNALNSEFQQLMSEIDRISDVTEYNGQKLIDGSISASANALSFQIGFQNVTANDRISLTISNADASALTIHGGTFSAINSVSAAQSMLTQVDSAIALVATWRGDIGAKQSRISIAISNLTSTAENYDAAVGSITDADFASETAKFTRNQIITQAATSVLAQANVLPQQVLTLLK
ncbi:MAG: flagellin FliC [Deltaproteobacteria bacterium]|nr:flagellin FliC [Deltaproteobacteria bacterium]